MAKVKVTLTKSEAEYLMEVLDQLCWDQANCDKPPHTFELSRLEPLLAKVEAKIDE